MRSGTHAKKERNGFTLIETMMVLVIGSMLLTGFHFLFSQGVRSSVKGMDLLESIRAANEVFVVLRKDLRAATRFATDKPGMVLEPGTIGFPSLEGAYSETLLFSQGAATAAYTLAALPDGRRCIKRELRVNDAVSETRIFALQRLKSFRAVKISQEQRVKPGHGMFVEDQALVEIEVESNDPRFPAGRVRLSSFLVSGQMTQTSWWNAFAGD